MASYLKIVVAMLIWSTWGLLVRWIALSPVVVLFYTSLIGGITVPLVLKIKGDFPRAVLSFRSWHLFAGLAIASILNNIEYFYALGHTTVSNAVFTHYTAPIFVAVLAPLLIAERLQRVTFIALPLAAAGMVMIVAADGGINLGGAHMPGILAGTISGVAYAFLVIFTRLLSRMQQHQKAILLLLWVTIAVTAPIALTADYQLNARTGILLFITGVFHSTAAPLLYFSALRKVLAQHAAILGYIEPLAAIPLAFFFLFEEPPIIALLGGILILCSGYLIIRSKTVDAGLVKINS